MADNKKDIVIILNESYPHGMACSRRIHLYAKGLVEEGKCVNVIIPKAQEKDKSINTLLQGNYEGVNYKYTTNAILRSKSVLRRKWDDIFNPIRSFFVILKLKPQNIVLVSNQTFHIGLFKILSLLLGAYYYREKSEVPYFEKETISWFDVLKIKISFSLFNGIIVVSNELKNFFQSEIGVKSKVFVIPIIMEDIPDSSEKLIKRRYSILYSGSLLEHKDGISSIIKAIAEVKKEISHIKLYITGAASTSPDYKRVAELIQELNIEENVSFTGYLSQEELERLMREVEILISAKPSNRQNKYNFPTKLGEYLSSGTPVLTTRNTALSEYLIDGKDVYFTNQDYLSISDSIKRILSNYEQAKVVGLNGKEVASVEFNYRYCVKSLSKFLSHER